MAKKHWFHGKSPGQQRAYLSAHPTSKYHRGGRATHGRTSSAPALPSYRSTQPLESMSDVARRAELKRMKDRFINQRTRAYR